jgi:hypothetical protein
MELVAESNGIMRAIIETIDEFTIFNILRRHIIIDTGILHRGKIAEYAYECDPHVFTLFFREYTLEDILKYTNINKNEYELDVKKKESLAEDFLRMKHISEAIGVLNDFIIIEYDWEIQEQIINKELDDRYETDIPKDSIKKLDLDMYRKLEN